MTKMMLKIAGLTFLALSSSTMANSSGQLDSIKTAVEQIMAKAGILFSGEFRSQYLTSTIGGNDSDEERRTDESAEFTSVDFDIKARPNTLTQGHAIFRMHQDWRNFFSDIANPIFTRWLSIDGSLKQMFSYSVGDFKQKYTPLTLFAPGIDILGEPEIFKRERQVAQNELFLGDNQRLLQGVNVNFAAEVDPLFNAVRVGLLGVRLRGLPTSIQNGFKVANEFEYAGAEKFLYGGNADLTFLDGISLGGNYLNIFDNKATFKGRAGTEDTLQNTTIKDVRFGLDAGTLLHAENWKTNLTAELAMSADDSAYFDTTNAQKTLTKKAINGNALRIEANAGFNAGTTVEASVKLAFLNTASTFRNELAQSPDFIGRRIMNVENDSTKAGNRFDVNSQHYSTFDALYRSVFKFAPSDSTNMFFKSPYSKNAYTNTVFTQAELAARAQSKLDPSVQLIMPFGPATPNRTGIDASADFEFLQHKIKATGVFSALKEIDSTPIIGMQKLPPSTFSKLGGALSVDFGSFIGWGYPVRVSSSMVLSGAKNSGIAADPLYGPSSITSAFYCEDLYVKFWKRMAFLGGLEFIANAYKQTYTVKQNQMLYSGGLEYKLAEGSYLTGTIGRIGVTNTSTDPLAVALLDPSKSDFSMALINLYLQVGF